MGRDPVLIVFAKAPRAGFVKTRLAAGLGSEEALHVYRRMTEMLWSSWRKAQCEGAFNLWLCFDPPEAENEIRTWLPGADRYLPQVPGDLGRRMVAALDVAVAESHPRIALVGTDAPTVMAPLVQEAFSRVSRGVVVIGPSLDGGFYLMACSPAVPDLHALFETTPWSTPRTLEVFKAGLEARGIAVQLLSEARDIDTLQDLEAHRQSPDGRLFPL